MKNINDWLEAIKRVRARPHDNGFVTVQDIVRQSGKTEREIRAGLRALKEQGKLVLGSVKREKLSGVATLLPAYKLADSRSAYRIKK